jgi:phosphonoacetaldehyde hydrolase
MGSNMTNTFGPFRAVLFDWAGTTVDYGSRAPAAVFVEIFRRRGVAITTAEAREPMGRAKLDHIATISQMPRVRALWTDVHGQEPSAYDVEEMYREFLPLQKDVLAQGSDVIPGVPEAVAWCRERGLKIGSSTGYTRELMDVVVPLAAQSGYSPDVVLCPDDVPAGRPAPWLNFRAAERLDVYPMNQILVVDDTPVGIAAGLNAGCCTVAVSQTGNALGLSLPEVQALSAGQLKERLEQITHHFRAVGAHYVIRSVAELPALLESLETLPR